MLRVFREAPPGVRRRPVTQLTFLANYRIAGLSPAGFRGVNIAVHIVNVFLVYLLSNLLISSFTDLPPTGSMAASLIAAAIWGLHPIQTQAVTYIVQRATSLMATFFLTGVISFVKGRQSHGRIRLSYWVGAALAFILALGTKESAAVFPYALLLLEIAFRASEHEKLWTSLTVTTTICLAAGAVMLGGLAMGGAGFTTVVPIKGFSPYQRLLSEGRVLWLYLSLILLPFPWRFSIDRDFPISGGLLHPVTTLAAWSGIVIVVGWAVCTFRKKPFLSLAILWFLGTQAIEASFLPLDLVYEHREYLPTVLLSVWIASRLVGILGFPGVEKKQHGQCQATD